MPPTATHRYKELHLGQLRAFCACVRCETFSAAARALGLSQPAVWQQVRALERDLGVALLQRHGRRWQPSEDGRVLLELAADILGSVDSLQERFDQRRRNVPRGLVLIGSPGVVAEELAQPVVAFCRQHPHVQLTLLSYSGLRSLDMLLAGDADLAVLPLASEVLAQRPLLASEPLCERPWVLVVPKKHPLARRRRLSLEEVARHPLILPERESNWRRRVEDAFRTAQVRESLRVVLEVSLTLAARRYVSLGLGIALLPQPTEALAFPQLATRDCSHLLPPEPIVFLWRRGVALSPQARLFVDFARRQFAERSRK